MRFHLYKEYMQSSKYNIKRENISFINFATNSVLVENKDIMNTLFQFLDRKINCEVEINNNHNKKKYYYQYIEGSNIITIGICMNCLNAIFF